MGIQGSGKSTQGNLLSKKLNIPYLSSGHIFREIAKEETEWGKYVRQTVNSGQLIPDEKVVPIVEEYLSKPEYAKGFILDGFPRTLNQVHAFNHPIDLVILVELTDKEALWRLSSRNDGRDDETLGAVRKRIELFHTLTEPVIHHYGEKNILKKVNGEKKKKKVFEDITTSLPPSSA